jgi:riboflavin biosynthesis pyrimidine reductase
MRSLTGSDTPFEAMVAQHVALGEARPEGRALVRLNMISSADGGASLDGVSGALGGKGDHAVFAALREQADVVLVGMSTVVTEQYHPPTRPDTQLLVVTSKPDVSGNPELFTSGRATLVLPEDAAAAPSAVPTLRAGTGARVDLTSIVADLAGKVVMLEGGPTLAGLMVALGLVDEFFLTVSPRLVAGDAARVAHGPGADPALWNLVHAFADDEDFLFLRYGRPNVTHGRAPS